jgi:uncharacterized delta-60 repeat protein
VSVPRNRVGALAVAVVAILHLTTTVGHAAPPFAGDLDTKFGGTGTVTTAIYPGEVVNAAEDVLVQADGKILVAGWTNSPEADSPPPSPRPSPGQPPPPPDPGTGQDLVLVRYLPDGELDTTLSGGKGIVVVPVAPGDNFDIGTAIAQQADGKILVAGTAYMGATGADFAVVRFNPDGTLDTTFDGDTGTGNGKVTIAIGPGDNSDNGLDLTVVPGSNDILIAGTSDMGPGFDTTVVRLKSDGTLDQAFDGDSGIANGKVTIAVTPARDTAEAVALYPIKPKKAKPSPTQPPGKTTFRIVLAGVRHQSDQDTSVVRLNPKGKLDTSFSGNGIDVMEVAPAGKDDYAFDVLVHGGKIVTAGYAVMAYPGGGFQFDFALTRHRGNGTMDPDFKGDGIVTTRFPGNSPSWAFAMVRQGDGKYVVGGWVCFDPAGAVDFDYALARYLPNGTLDKSFGGDGMVMTAIAPYKAGTVGDEIRGLALQGDGMIVAAGNSDPIPNTGMDHSAARYHGVAQ